jgi:hypothetical protein
MLLALMIDLVAELGELLGGELGRVLVLAATATLDPAVSY